ncbi:MFS transporter [Oceanobacillus zhaokaii]|uniref:MFS transporter n=1 Tax=Oceanobacillus zhaokaii TaxID=2052660 RepID=A0A345PJK1_9BACI|nr:MFS transporter [Oceanobacillus zhaokaii]AXI10181.1 MFS transporter [Oceanobacillus zhaokaii]
MLLKNKIASWKYRSILLLGIGISNIGEWVYFIALNLIVLDMTGSPLAVSGLYIIKPLATLFTNFWSGSIIDRLNKRRLMIFLDIFRAMLITLLPLISSIPLIYFIVFILNMASSLFEPTSMTYITKLIPVEARKKFNSLYSLVTSGAFLTGPAVAGMLFLIGSPEFAIYLNAIALFLSGLITFLMPNLEKQMIASTLEEKMTIGLLKNDWTAVFNFSRKYSYIMIISFLFSCVMVVMASAVDSLEAAFAKEVLFLSDSEYGFLVTIAGAGIITGAMINVLLLKNIRTSLLIGCGAVFVSTGYIIYAFSDSFLSAGIGFFILSFFIAYANTGYLTFYQNNIPVNMMGRVRSIYSLIEALLIIAATGIMGMAAQMISIQLTVIIGVFVMVILSLILLIFSLYPSKKEFYQA